MFDLSDGSRVKGKPSRTVILRSKIFNKFYQEESSHSGEGNGVGLAIVKRVVELHNGSIAVDCAGGFTTFTVII